MKFIFYIIISKYYNCARIIFIIMMIYRFEQEYSINKIKIYKNLTTASYIYIIKFLVNMLN